MTGKKHFSAGNTFTEGEIQLIEYIANTLLRGGDPRMATRHKEFASVCRKIRSMKESIQRQKENAAEQEGKNESLG